MFEINNPKLAKKLNNEGLRSASGAFRQHWLHLQ
jgi:hypothetical protein